MFVLNKMSCPQRVEPHQLQGIDVPTVYNVVQWLVKRAVESRGEMIAFLKKFANDAFERTHGQRSESATNQLIKHVSTRVFRMLDVISFNLQNFRNRASIPVMSCVVCRKFAPLQYHRI